MGRAVRRPEIRGVYDTVSGRLGSEDLGTQPVEVGAGEVPLPVAVELADCSWRRRRISIHRQPLRKFRRKKGRGSSWLEERSRKLNFNHQCNAAENNSELYRYIII